ncbi:ionotropic receptor 21a-like [Panulirus ornatus]|uniref:ionotropic receptor 21a-like n=1 Tax=Panulirus ornatus TaxID=150431 RepID=UPI003A859E07
MMRANVILVTILLSDVMAESIIRSRMKVDAGGALQAVLEGTSQSSCSVILLIDGNTIFSNILEAVSSERSSPRGVTVMEVTATDGQDANVTLAMLSHLISQARRLRLGSWCVSVVVASHDPEFLIAFAESSLKGRFLVWATRLLVVTRLTLPQLYALLPTHWTFSMMNTIFLNLENTSTSRRASVYIYLPYSQAGAQVVRIASWSPDRGVRLLTELPLLPEKYDDFQGGTVPVTAKPFPPYWVEEYHQAANGTTVKIYTGTDGEMLHAVAGALNFTFRVIPITNWVEAVEILMRRESFIIPVYYTVLPQRLKQFDVTYTYEFAFMSFGMKKPGLRPSWQSLYYPLADMVWATVLALLLIIPIVLIVVIRVGGLMGGENTLEAGAVVQDMAGMLLGQNLPRRLPSTSSSRLLVAAWLVFAFIIGTVYRGNLTAHLTLPKYPPRPETAEQLVKVVDRVTRPPYSAAYKEFFLRSENEVFQKLGELLYIGPQVVEGLQQALDHNQAVIEGRRYMEHYIAENFTRPDGSTELYVGRHHILPGLAAWAIPHDAPYRPQIDLCMMAVIEAGLYEKWSSDQMAKARQRSSRRQREYLAQQQQQQQQEVAEETASGKIMALTFTHMQGPIILLFLGLVLAGISFTVEFSASVCQLYTKQTSRNHH